jgi:alpha-glucosidase
VLAFVREADGEAVACLFNFSDKAVSVALPPSMTINAVSGHGFAGRIDGRSVSLAGGDAFFGAVG